MKNIIVSGRVGSIQPRETATGTVLNFFIATSGKTKDDAPTWVECALWGVRGEKIARHLKVGDRVLASGPLEFKPYARAQGEPAVQVHCRVESFEFLRSGSQASEQPT